MPKSNEDFVADWKASLVPQWRTAIELRDMGFDALMRPPSLRPDFADRAEYSDDGDVKVTMTVQVKKRDLDFTCAADYPYDTIIVDEQYKIRVDTLAYWIWNKTETCIAVIGRSTRRSWCVERRWDAAQGRECDFMMCPKELADFRVAK